MRALSAVGSALGRNFGHAGGDSVRIARKVVADEVEPLVKFEDVGCGRGQVEVGYGAVGGSSDPGTEA